MDAARMLAIEIEKSKLSKKFPLEPTQLQRMLLLLGAAGRAADLLVPRGVLMSDVARQEALRSELTEAMALCDAMIDEIESGLPLQATTTAVEIVDFKDGFVLRTRESSDSTGAPAAGAAAMDELYPTVTQTPLNPPAEARGDQTGN